jgi:TonB-dependent starch-binding outer membrane protein SusC
MCEILRIGFLILLFLLMEIVCYAQNITLKCKNARFEDILGEIMTQANISFITCRSFNESKKRISLDIKNMPLKDFLDILLKDQQYEFLLIDNICSIRNKEIEPHPKIRLMYGKVVNQWGEPIEGVCVTSVNNHQVYLTDHAGKFKMRDIKPGSLLSYSCRGYEQSEVKYSNHTYVLVVLRELKSTLDTVSVVVNTGYQRFENHKVNPVFRVSEKELLRSVTVTNVFASLEGRVPGLLITQSNGLPGTDYQVQLRGQSSIGILPGIRASNNPLIIIDGFSLPGSNSLLPILAPINATGVQGSSLVGNINPDDIESILVLKDAEATAIFGSRGANGVIQINTKKGNPGPPALEIKNWLGPGWATRMPEMLNTEEYIKMRREAFLNSKIIADKSVAPDLLIWDSARYTNFKEEVVGGTALKHNVQTAISGGSLHTQYHLSGGYYRETTVFPSDITFNKKTLHGHVTHKSVNDKLSVDLVSMLAVVKNGLSYEDIAPHLLLPPNAASLYDSAERSSNNPLTRLHHADGVRLFSTTFRGQLNYRLLKKLQFTFSLGFNRVQSRETGFLPLSSLFPYTAAASEEHFYSVKNFYRSLIAEPQLLYTVFLNQFKYTCLLGTTFQHAASHNANTFTYETPHDFFTLNPNTNRYIDHSATDSKCNYIGFFSRLGFQLMDKYQMNITVCRDKSNRLSINNRFGNFGAVSVAWIFSNEPFFKKAFPFVSYGKLRGSYGVNGDDQIAENNYSGAWPGFYNINQQLGAPYHVRIIDANYSWQISRKLELGFELGLVKDQVFLSVAAYRNRVGNQVIGYANPSLGLNTVIARNSSAVVQNKGLEIWLQLKNNKVGQCRWNSNLALTIPNNKLIAFPNLSTSPYANTLALDRSLSVQRGYKYTGVNTVTGLFEVNDRDGDSKINRAGDYSVIGDLEPKLYGSVELGLNYRNWELNIFLEGRVQKAYSALFQMYSYATPGADIVNVPDYFRNRWRKPGDQSNIQRVSTKGDWEATNAINNYLESDARLTSASYIRLRNIYFAYNLPVVKSHQRFFKTLRLFIVAGNLFTVTNYKGADPETQTLFTLPPLQTLVAGIQVSL